MQESAEWCVMVPDGTDTDGTEWNRCTVHDALVLGDAYVCEGYRAPEYRDPAVVAARIRHLSDKGDTEWLTDEERAELTALMDQ